MGYESRIYIVDKSDLACIKNGKRMVYCEMIAQFNLSKVPKIYEKVSAYDDTDGYFYSNGKEIVEDLYGKPLKEIPVRDMISIISEVMKDDAFRRYKPCLNLLKGFNVNHWQNLVVLHYGY